MQKGGSRRLGCMVAFSFITGVTFCAAPQVPQKGQDVNIRTTTRIVEFSVVATDSKGRMIGDLMNVGTNKILVSEVQPRGAKALATISSGLRKKY